MWQRPGFTANLRGETVANPNSEMPRKDWQTIKDTFHEALRRDTAERDAFLSKVCGDDIDFRIEVESLLTSLSDAKNFLEQPLIGGSGRRVSAWNLENGQAISHYRIISPIGSGGMGDVYLARDQQLNRQVALKVLPEELLENRERLQRFQREAHVVSALNHPNILTVFEFGTAGDVHFLASEFVKGDTLRTRLRRGKLALCEALDIATQIASALKAAHDAGVVHRDIKPDNVMIRDDGYVKVLDFGLAKPTPEATADHAAETQRMLSRPGIIMGTATYMSPEQARGRATDGRSDIFSFGIVLFEMLTGMVPFLGDTTADVVAAVIQAQPPKPSSINPAVPEELDRMIEKCLEKDRTDRYPSASDLVSELKLLSKQYESTTSVRENEPALIERKTEITGEGETGPEPSFHATGKRQLLLAAGIAAIVTLLVLALLVSFYFGWPNFRQIGSIPVMPFVNESSRIPSTYVRDDRPAAWAARVIW